MTTSRIEELRAILQEHFDPREDGWLWVATCATDADGGVVNQREGEYAEPKATAHALGRMINAATPDIAYVALCRRDGRPTESDRELWRELCRLVTRERLIDLVVFNQRQAWSMRADDVAAA